MLCMEKFSQVIEAYVNEKKWKPVKVARDSPSVSHVFFADDLILFSEASIDHAHSLKACLDHYCKISGHQVNFDKSRMMCSANTNNMIANICNSPLTSELRHYLGVPLISKRIAKHTYSYIIDKMSSNLAAWKSHTLSLAGRLTLVKSVTATIPIYSM